MFERDVYFLPTILVSYNRQRLRSQKAVDRRTALHPITFDP